MLIKTGFDLTFITEKATPMVIMLSIHPSRIDDIVDGEQIVAEPYVPIHFYHDSFGNLCGRLTAPAGGVRLRGSALVRDSGLLDAVEPNAIQHPIEELLDECLLYLLASRYCETDKLTDVAWSLFRDTPPGWARVQAICTFVHNHLTFGYEHASPTKSAHDAYLQKKGRLPGFRAPGAHLVPLHEYSRTVRHRIHGRHRYSPRWYADGFFRMVRSVFVRQVAYLRRTSQ